MFSLKTAEVGQTLRFFYTGGSARDFRLVRVTAVEAEAIRGVDLLKDEVRNYKFDRSSSIQVVAAANEALVFPRSFLAVDTEALPGETLLSIYRQLHPRVRAARWSEVARAVVIKVPVGPAIEFEVRDNQVVLRYLGEGDREPLTILFPSPEGSKIDGRGTLRVRLAPEAAAEHARRVAEVFAPPTPPTPPAPPPTPAVTDTPDSLETLIKSRLYPGYVR